MNRYPLPPDLFEYLYKVWIDDVDDTMIFEERTVINDGFCFHFRQLGWDMQWDEDAITYTIPKEQASFFLLKYS